VSSTLCRGSGETPPIIFFSSGNMSHFFLIFCVHCSVVFRHMIFADGFLFPVKESWLLTNPGHWVRVMNVVGSYMYIVL
jgi:hypothetical protein